MGRNSITIHNPNCSSEQKEYFVDDKMYEEPSLLALPHQSVSRRAVLKAGLGLAIVASGAGALLSRASFTRASSPGNVVIQWNLDARHKPTSP
jgi:hypothetical protein